MDPTSIATGLASNPLAWMLALALLAIGYLFRLRVREARIAKKEVDALQAQLLESSRADAKDQRELLAQVIPLAAKMTEGLEILERVTDSLTRDDDDDQS